MIDNARNNLSLLTIDLSPIPKLKCLQISSASNLKHHRYFIQKIFSKMIEQNANLGKLVSVHGISPAFLQRAMIVVLLSFVFFLATLAAFYAWQKFGYFLLSTAFLIVYIVTMFSWVMVRKSVLKIYENGFSYKNFKARWEEIEKIDVKMISRLLGSEKITCEITKINTEKVVLSEAIQDILDVIETIDDKMAEANGETEE